jgi:hypothetical protein
MSPGDGPAADVEPVAADVEPVAADVEPVAADVEPVAADVEPVAADVEPVAADVEPVAADVEPVAGVVWLLVACAVELPQIVPAFLACFLPPGLAVAVPVPVPVAVALAVEDVEGVGDVGDVEDVEGGLLLALLVALGLALPESSTAGLVSWLGAGLDGLAESDVVAGGLDVTDVEVAEAAADDCGQGAIGAGRCFPGAADAAAPAPPPAV